MLPSAMNHVIQFNSLYSRNQSSRQVDQFAGGVVSEEAKTPSSYTLPSAKYYQKSAGPTERYNNLAFEDHM